MAHRNRSAQNERLSLRPPPAARTVGLPFGSSAFPNEDAGGIWETCRFSDPHAHYRCHTFLASVARGLDCKDGFIV